MARRRRNFRSMSPLDLRADMHNLGIPVYHHVIGDFDRADLGNSTEVIAAQIDQHIKSKALHHRQAAVFERLVLLRCFAARTRARETGKVVRRPLSSRTSVSSERNT